MFEEVKKYFNFNKGERIGIVVVISIIVMVLAFPYLIKYTIKDNNEEFIQFAKEIQIFEKGLKESTDSVNEVRRMNFQQMDKSVAENKLAPFPFNPNNLPSEQWSKLGLRDWQIKVIKNYEAKGGKFFKKEDFKKMFCISPSEYALLESYISIPEVKKEYLDTKAETRSINKRTIIDLNTADSVALLTLNGIGPSFAKRIIKYRNLLGGFYSKTQLLEVYGFDQGKLDKIEAYCEVSSGGLTKIHVNSVKTEELKKHPYLDYYTAKAIVDQRIILGKYASIQQIKEIPLIHDDLYNKIKPYLLID
jgi:DNA uptake protein ComE-like DNA-binding protein